MSRILKAKHGLVLGVCARHGTATDHPYRLRCLSCVRARRCAWPTCRRKVGPKTRSWCGTHTMRLWGVPRGPQAGKGGHGPTQVKCLMCKRIFEVGDADGRGPCPACRKAAADRLCDVPSCGRPRKRHLRTKRHSLGYSPCCAAHARRQSRNGSPTAGRCVRCHSIYERPEIGKDRPLLCPRCRRRKSATRRR